MARWGTVNDAKAQKKLAACLRVFEGSKVKDAKAVTQQVVKLLLNRTAPAKKGESVAVSLRGLRNRIKADILGGSIWIRSGGKKALTDVSGVLKSQSYMKRVRGKHGQTATRLFYGKKVVVKRSALTAIIKQKQANAGILLAGWMPLARWAGSKVPAVLTSKRAHGRMSNGAHKGRWWVEAENQSKTAARCRVGGLYSVIERAVLNRYERKKKLLKKL